MYDSPSLVRLGVLVMFRLSRGSTTAISRYGCSTLMRISDRIRLRVEGEYKKLLGYEGGTVTTVPSVTQPLLRMELHQDATTSHFHYLA